MRDLYSVLNLSRRGNSRDIKAAYRALAKQFHPDVHAGDLDAEPWTKEINRAYAILGDPDARAAYDLEVARQRAKARRSFLGGAAAGTATVILTVGSISIALMWKQDALRTSAKNEMLVAKAPAKDRHTLRPATEPREMGADLGQSAPHPQPSSEPLASTRPEIISAVLTDREAPTSAAPAPSANVMEEPPEAGSSAAPSESAREHMPEGQPVLPQAPDRHPPLRTGLVNVVSPQVEAKQPAPTAMADRKSSGEAPRDKKKTRGTKLMLGISA